MFHIDIINSKKDKIIFNATFYGSFGRKVNYKKELTGDKIYNLLTNNIPYPLKELQIIAKDTFTTGQHFTEMDKKIYLLNLPNLEDDGTIYKPINTTYIEIGKIFPLTEDIEKISIFNTANAYRW
jgi:hypothetical protein